MGRVCGAGRWIGSLLGIASIGLNHHPGRVLASPGMGEDLPISHIVGNLWQGGCEPGVVLPRSFVHVTCLSESFQYVVPDSASLTVHPLVDAANIELSYEAIDGLAFEVWERCQVGPVLVHCQAGWNRSGLVAACALVRGGYRPDQAIALLRRRRFPEVLSNRLFESFVLSYRPLWRG